PRRGELGASETDRAGTARTEAAECARRAAVRIRGRPRQAAPRSPEDVWERTARSTHQDLLPPTKDVVMRRRLTDSHGGPDGPTGALQRAPQSASLGTGQSRTGVKERRHQPA